MDLWLATLIKARMVDDVETMRFTAVMKEVPPMAPKVKATDGSADEVEFLTVLDFYVRAREKVRTWLGSGGRLPASATP